MSLSLGSAKMNLAVGIQNLIIYELFHETQSQNVAYWIDGYQNCREQGITVFFSNEKGQIKSVTISEERRSDMIAVYLDNKEFQGVSEESYKNIKTFDYGRYTEAVKFCVNHLLS